MSEPTPEELKEAHRLAKKREQSRRHRQKIKTDPVRYRAYLDTINKYKRERKKTDPEFRKHLNGKLSRRLQERRSPEGGDPEYRAKKLAYLRDYNRKYYERMKDVPGWLESRRVGKRRKPKEADNG